MPSVSCASSESAVWKNTREPSAVVPWKAENSSPLPPSGPVEISVVEPAARSYMSVEASVSWPTSGSWVSKNTREPFSLEPTQNAPVSALPPETSVIAAPTRSYTSFAVSESPPTSTSSVCSHAIDPSTEAPSKNAS